MLRRKVTMREGEYYVYGESVPGAIPFGAIDYSGGITPASGVQTGFEVNETIDYGSFQIVRTVNGNSYRVYPGEHYEPKVGNVVPDGGTLPVGVTPSPEPVVVVPVPLAPPVVIKPAPVIALPIVKPAPIIVPEPVVKPPVVPVVPLPVVPGTPATVASKASGWLLPIAALILLLLFSGKKK
jgi:hypothetical protein